MTNIQFTTPQLRATIEALSCYRHDMRELPDSESNILSRVQDKLVEEYQKIQPNFIPFY